MFVKVDCWQGYPSILRSCVAQGAPDLITRPCLNAPAVGATNLWYGVASGVISGVAFGAASGASAVVRVRSKTQLRRRFEIALSFPYDLPLTFSQGSADSCMTSRDDMR